MLVSVFQSLLLLIMVVLRKRVKLAVALFNEAGKCLAAIPCLFLQPVITFLILVAFFIYWLIVLAFLTTAGQFSFTSHIWVEIFRPAKIPSSVPSVIIFADQKSIIIVEFYIIIVSFLFLLFLFVWCLRGYSW